MSSRTGNLQQTEHRSKNTTTDLKYYYWMALRNGRCMEKEEGQKVFHAVMSWVKKDLRNRRSRLDSLLTHVRLPLLTPEFLIKHVATEKLIHTSHNCRDLLDEAKDCHLMPERCCLMPLYKIIPRSSVMGRIYVFSNDRTKVEAYDPINDCWEVIELKIASRTRFCVAATQNKIYVIGGTTDFSDEFDTVDVFDPKTQGWSTSASMNYKRRSVSATVLLSKIYVFDDRVECYDPFQNKWTVVTKIPEWTSYDAVVACNGLIYVLNGKRDKLWCYNPESGSWTEIPGLQTKRSHFGAAALGGKIYVCGGLSEGLSLKQKYINSVEVYDPVTKKWSYIEPMNEQRAYFATVANCGCLYAIGSHCSYTVERYNPLKDQWKFVAPVNTILASRHAAVISSPIG